MSDSIVIGCVTCGGSAVELPPDTREGEVGVLMVKAQWRRVVGGWRCPSCIKEEEDAA